MSSDPQSACLHFSNLVLRKTSFIKFTSEKDRHQPFPDVCVKRTNIGFESSVYRKPTFTSQYLCWDSSSPDNHYVCLIPTIVCPT